MRNISIILSISSAIIFYVALTTNFKDVVAGTEGGDCPDRSVLTIGPGGIPDAFIPCDYDCRTNHNSARGNCTTDGTWNCVCSGTKTDTNTCTYFNGYERAPLVCQCATNSTLNLAGTYDFICENDCTCNHGASKGTCDWNLKQCICDYPAGFTWTNGSSSTCKYQGVFNTTQVLADAIRPILHPILEEIDSWI